MPSPFCTTELCISHTLTPVRRPPIFNGRASQLAPPLVDGRRPDQGCGEVVTAWIRQSILSLRIVLASCDTRQARLVRPAKAPTQHGQVLYVAILYLVGIDRFS